MRVVGAQSLYEDNTMKLKFGSNIKMAQPDPFMCEIEDGWAMYVTGVDGIGAYFADSPFGTWEYKGIIYQAEDSREYWAPCAIFLDGWYYLYFSCAKNSVNEHAFEYMHVAKSKSPFGPFEDAKCIYEEFSIDPHVVQTGEGLFLWYAKDNVNCDRVGTRVYVDRLLDPYTPQGCPIEMITPSFDEEIFMENRFLEGQHWHTIEGPFWLEKDGYQYVMYSGACYQNETYHIGYASAKSDEQDLTKVAFTKHTKDGAFEPLLTKNEVEEGVGHHSVICYQGEYYAVYHGRDVGETELEGDARTARICKLYFKEGTITAERM